MHNFISYSFTIQELLIYKSLLAMSFPTQANSLVWLSKFCCFTGMALKKETDIFELERISHN